MEERNYEEEAQEQGWNPDFDGPNKVDAKTFVERGEKIAGILKSKVDRLESRVESLTQSNKQFGEYHKQTIEQQRDKAAKQINGLKTELAQAITDGDGQAYTRAQNEIDSLQAQNVPVTDANAFNQLSQSWVAENPWYTSNRKLARYADGLAEEVVQEGYQGAAYFSELTRRVKEDFPEEFENPNKSKPNSVEESGQISTKKSKAKTYANLPADAKAAVDSFVSQGFMTQEDYLATYEWEE